jgi:hypothetical protein
VCWFIGYFEVRKKAAYDAVYRDCYDSLNRSETFPKPLQFVTTTIDGQEMFSVEHNQCACDLFRFDKPGKKQLSRSARESLERREVLRTFISGRMAMPFLEPRLLLVWQSGEEIMLPPKAQTWPFGDFEALFRNGLPGLFRLY